METKTKVILTLIGLGAIVVPAVLLVIFSNRGNGTTTEAGTGGGNRQIRQDLIQNELLNNPLNQVVVSPSPFPSPVVPASPRVSPTPLKLPIPTPPLESTPGSVVN